MGFHRRNRQGSRQTRLLLLIFLLALVHPALAQTLTGRVVAVHDGDTLTLLTAARRQVRVRLHGIDAPELKQPFGTRARQALAQATFGKVIEAVVRDTDRYGRTVADVFVAGININQSMTRAGYAFWYRQYAPRDSTLAALEAEARSARRGLWMDRNPTPPWQWLREAGATQTAARRAPAAVPRPAARRSPSVLQRVSVPAGTAVYVEGQGKRYHRASCRHLHGTVTLLSRPQARARGYTACRVCRP